MKHFRDYFEIIILITAVYHECTSICVELYTNNNFTSFLLSWYVLKVKKERKKYTLIMWCGPVSFSRSRAKFIFVDIHYRHLMF